MGKDRPCPVDTIIIVWMFCAKRGSPLGPALLCSIKSGLSRTNVYSVPLINNVQTWRKYWSHGDLFAFWGSAPTFKPCFYAKQIWCSYLSTLCYPINCMGHLAFYVDQPLSPTSLYFTMFTHFFQKEYTIITSSNHLWRIVLWFLRYSISLICSLITMSWISLQLPAQTFPNSCSECILPFLVPDHVSYFVCFCMWYNIFLSTKNLYSCYSKQE
jgi:hypothetical protein